jgi:hypothetical protein
MKLIQTCDIFKNEVVMEEHNVEEESEINWSLESKTIRNLQFSEEEIMQQHLKKLHNQKKFWKLKGRNVLYIGFSFA